MVEGAFGVRYPAGVFRSAFPLLFFFPRRPAPVQGPPEYRSFALYMPSPSVNPAPPRPYGTAPGSRGGSEPICFRPLGHGPAGTAPGSGPASSRPVQRLVAGRWGPSRGPVRGPEGAGRRRVRRPGVVQWPAREPRRTRGEGEGEGEGAGAAPLVAVRAGQWRAQNARHRTQAPRARAFRQAGPCTPPNRTERRLGSGLHT